MKLFVYGLFKVLTNYFDIKILSGKERSKKCETHRTEKCCWNTWFEHPVLAAWRDISRGIMPSVFAWIPSTALLSVVSLNLMVSLIWLCYNLFSQEQVKARLFCCVNRIPPNRYGYVSNLCVAKSARRQGIARNMLHFAVESAISNGKIKVEAGIFVYLSNSDYRIYLLILFSCNRCWTGICACA